MIARTAGALALAGGLAWVVKVTLIWHNGGTNTTGGLVGVLFLAGAVAILVAAVLRVGSRYRRAPLRTRLLAGLATVVGFVVAVDLPILVGWLVFGRTWMAEETGVVLTAVAAVLLGIRWLREGHSTRPGPRSTQPLGGGSG